MSHRDYTFLACVLGVFLLFFAEKMRAEEKPYGPPEGPVLLADGPASAPSQRPGASSDGATPYIISRGPSNVPAGIPWQRGEFNVLAQDQDLRDLLRQFATAYGVRISVSDKIDVKVSGRFEGLRPEEFLEQMCRAYNLMTFYDGNMLYVYRNDESSSTIIQLRKVPPSRLLNVLRLLGLSHPAYAIRAVEDEGILMVSGPPKFLETVNDLATKMDTTAQSAPAEATLRVFYLKNAWANDLTFDYRDTSVTVPGVATSLQNLMAGGASPVGSNGVTTRSLRSGTVPNLMGKGLASERPQAAPGTRQVAPTQLNNAKASTVSTEGNGASGGTSSNRARGEGQNAGQGDGMGNIATSGGGQLAAGEVQPVIQADVRLNAVIVRDSKDKMEQYETLIDALDQPVEVIEITAAIVDVESTYTYQLGIDWSFSTAGESNATGIGLAPGTSSTSTANGGASPLAPSSGAVPGANLPSFSNLVPGSGLNFATVIVDSGMTFLANVKALESQGRARTLSRPSVLTLDNVEALIQREETAYVKVNGFQAVDLFNVSTGVKLKVTPHVIDDKGGRRRVKLVVDIEDGSFTASSTTDGVPNVQQSNINTQSVIMERQSLLVGGIFREEDNKNESGIPFIRKVPLVGALFKQDLRNKRKLERLFLITPRIVKLCQSDTRIPTVLDNSALPEAGEGHPPVTSSDPMRRATEMYPPDGMRGVEGRANSTYNLRNIAKPEPDPVLRDSRSSYRSSHPDKSRNSMPAPIRSRTVPAEPSEPLRIPPFSQNQNGGGSDARGTGSNTATASGTATSSSSIPQRGRRTSPAVSRGEALAPAPSAPAAPRAVPAPARRTPASQPAAPAPAPASPAPAPAPSSPGAPPMSPESVAANRRAMGDGGYAEPSPAPAPRATAVTPGDPAPAPAEAATPRRSAQRSKN
ncbi:EscC/YscC/HrcC family type III secretion system outer membrane ring protein [Verrucomicrobia bacterium LW23]|nr:EscC/YscC/HrcC family type III secretion system outer membrane ring protein [Verrucomicrobia bacterium LW23]